MTPPGSEVSGRDYCFDFELISRRTLFRAIVRRNPRSQIAVETLEMGHLGHTSDLECRIYGLFALENERRRPFQPGEDRHRRVEKRPVAKIGMRMRDDHRPLRPAHGENADQPSAILELPI